MNAPRLTDAQVSQALRAHLPDRAEAGLRERILEAAETTSQQRALPSFLGALSEADPVARRRSLLIAAALLVALAFASSAVVGALRILERDPVDQLSLEATPLPTPTPVPTVRPKPSGPAGPLAWSEASLKEDWPAPVRVEPDGGPIVLPILLHAIGGAEGWGKIESGRYSDPKDDTGSDVTSWADIKAVTFCGRACVEAWVPKPPNVDPTEEWIAFGLVADDDGDGVADRRFGMDNMPVDATGHWMHRAWITDLHTGQTVSSDRDDDECQNLPVPRQSICWDAISLVTSFPGRGDEQDGLSAAMLRVGVETIGGGLFGGLPERFYAWASVIRDGRVVATDYAPDVGRLEPSPDAKP